MKPRYECVDVYEPETSTLQSVIRLRPGQRRTMADLLPDPMRGAAIADALHVLAEGARTEQAAKHALEVSALATAASAKANLSGSRSAHAKAATAHRKAAALYAWGQPRKSVHNGMVQLHKQKSR